MAVKAVAFSAIAFLNCAAAHEIHAVQDAYISNTMEAPVAEALEPIAR